MAKITKPSAMTRGQFGYAYVTSAEFIGVLSNIAQIHFEHKDVSREDLFDGLRLFAAYNLSRKGKRGQRLDDPSTIETFVAENRSLLDPIVERALQMGGWGGAL
jgi:hypothetical protein